MAGLFSSFFKKKEELPPFHLSSLKVDMHSHLIPGIDDGAPTMALGIRGFIANQCGGGLINYFAGGASLQKACKAKEASFYHLIGAPQKDGVLKAIASYLKDGKLKPVIDKVFPFDKCVEAIMYQKAGRCAGKVVIEIAH